jgi:hypothetical protein
MAEIFLSYSSSDRPMAKAVAETIAQHGWSVWWDRKIPYGSTFDEVIEQNLEIAKCVIVLWSKESVLSRWVKTEASEGARRGILVPVLLQSTAKIPLEFRLMQAANLSDWQPGMFHEEFQRLIEHITGILGKPKFPHAEQQSAEYSRAKFEQPAREDAGRKQHEEPAKVVGEPATRGQTAREMSTQLDHASILSRKMLILIATMVAVVISIFAYQISFKQPTILTSAEPPTSGRESIRSPAPSAARDTRGRTLHFDTLKPGEIVLTDVFAGSGVRFIQGKGSPIIAVPEHNMVLPHGRKQVLLVGGERVTSLTIAFDPPIRRFSLTRIGTRGGSSVPTWTLDAFDSEGRVVASAGEEHGLPPEPRQFAVEGNKIVRVQLSTDNRFGEIAWATWNSLPVAEFEFVR